MARYNFQTTNNFITKNGKQETAINNLLTQDFFNEKSENVNC